MPSSAGSVAFEGWQVTGAASDAIVDKGIIQVPEGRRVFPNMTVKENLELGSYRRARSRRAENMARVVEVFPRLRERLGQLAGTLSGGEQQMLAIGRALMSRPRLLLLDEPSLGLAPMIVQRIFEIIREVNESEGVTILLVEQNANLALQASKRGYVLETGSVTMEDEATALLHNQEIRKAYLGE